MRIHPGNKLDFVSIGAIGFSAAVLICLAVVFAGCTSPSSSANIYFMKVNLSNFPEINGLPIRRSLDIGGVDASSITGGVASVVSTAAESTQSDLTEVSAAAQTAVSEVSTRLETLSKDLKSQLPEYYSIGLLGYCKGEDDKPTGCSNPTTSFSFNLSGIFNSVSTEVNDFISGIDETALTGYQNVVRALIWLYILAFIAAFLTTIFGIRKVFASGGNKLLLVSCTVCSLFPEMTLGVPTLIDAAFDNIDHYGNSRGDGYLRLVYRGY
ncbi:actin cortical patch SUR7/pH-response regulator pali [Penicillium sp. IBT 16267x]|nr:actin cortical patch SUR7/pH-response regulator pali [Penicillium sp. IBT 16267x]